MPAKKDPNKPRGRTSGYAYFVQTCREEHKRKHPNEQIVFTEFSKKCAKRWKPMTDKEKKAFNDMAERDRIRYEREMRNYVPPPGAAKKVKRKKDPNAPKRPQSAFFLFCADRRGQLKTDNPSWSVGEIAKELGKQWSTTSEEVKKKYAEKSEVEKEKYNVAMEKYRAQQSGDKSTNSKAAEKPASESDDSESESD